MRLGTAAHRRSESQEEKKEYLVDPTLSPGDAKNRGNDRERKVLLIGAFCIIYEVLKFDARW
jgi:hypothetical protein